MSIHPVSSIPAGPAQTNPTELRSANPKFDDKLDISMKTQLKSLLTKIRAGTVTEPELKKVQYLLNNLPGDTLNSNDKMAVLLGKIKDGSITAAELNALSK